MKTEESKLEPQQEQLDIPVVMHSILVKVITEAYRIGFDDGYADIYNAEIVGTDKSQLMPIEGEEQTISGLLKKYCA
jgi:hypothetical protein